MEAIEEDWDREDGKDDRDSACRVNTIALHLFWRHGVALGAHLEEHQTKDGERRKEKPGKNVMRGSNMLLQRCCVVVRRRGTKSDAERKKARQYPCDLVGTIVATATELKHRDGAETAFEKIPHYGVVVVADGGFEPVVQKPPRDRDRKWK